MSIILCVRVRSSDCSEQRLTSLDTSAKPDEERTISHKASYDKKLGTPHPTPSPR